jgi:hypothetical protein
MTMNDWLIKQFFYDREREWGCVGGGEGRYWRTGSLIQDLRGPPAIHLHFHFSSLTNELRFVNNVRVLHIYCLFCIHIQAGLICNFETECLNGICRAFFFLPPLRCFKSLRCGRDVHSFQQRSYWTGYSDIWFSRQSNFCTCQCKMNAVIQRNLLIKSLHTCIFSKKTDCANLLDRPSVHF